MDNGESVHFRNQREFSQPDFLSGVQLITRPLNSDFSERIEALQGTLGRSVIVMVALNHGTLQRLNDLQTLTRIGVITHYVSKADKGGAPLLTSVREYNFKRLEIGVNVAEYRNPHRGAKYETERDFSLRFCGRTDILQ